MIETDFKSWVDRLVQSCLPLDVQKKLLSSESLTKEEALKYTHVVQLVAQAKSMTKQDSLSVKLDRNTERILRAVRHEKEDKRAIDKRSPQERKLIDLAAIHYARRHYLDGTDLPLSESIRHVWKKHGNEAVFKDVDAFGNAVRYDLDAFYDMKILLARAQKEREF